MYKFLNTVTAKEVLVISSDSDTMEDDTRSSSPLRLGSPQPGPSGGHQSGQAPGPNLDQFTSSDKSDSEAEVEEVIDFDSIFKDSPKKNLKRMFEGLDDEEDKPCGPKFKFTFDRNSTSKAGASKRKSDGRKQQQKDEELALTIDELLTLPEKPDDDGKSMDELLDDLDVQIAEQKEKHRLQIKKLDADAMIQQKRKEDREVRYAANAINRDLLATELTQPILRKMFADIRGFLEDIKDGLIESSRHKAFHKSLKTRQALLYTMITHPFTDKQVDWVYEEMASIWLRTKQEHADNNEYIWKVLMPEGFIRLYSDFFELPLKEAEQRIGETPFDESDN